MNDMNEKKELSAKELYCWQRGYDNVDIETLSALNSIIGGLDVLQKDIDVWGRIAESIGSSTLDIAKYCDDIYDSEKIMELQIGFETIRTLLFGDKINYTKLLEMLRENVDECGWTFEKAEKRREEKRKELEKKRANVFEQMPERLKKQREEFKKANDDSDND